MKAISLHQPWATLVAIQAKQYETRSWYTSYRGPLIIHAAKRYDEGAQRGPDRTHFIKAFLDAGITHYSSQIPLGAYLCIVDLVNVVTTESVVNSLSEQEKAFGNYLPGRFAWKLENVRTFPEPVPARGFQGLWNPLNGIGEPMAKFINEIYALRQVATK